MMDSIDPNAVAAVKAAEAQSMTATGVNPILFSSILDGAAAANSGSTGTATTLAANPAASTGAGSSKNADFNSANNAGNIFLSQLATQQSYQAANAGSPQSDSAVAANQQLASLNYMAASAMMNHDLAALTASEAMIAQQMSNMGMGGALAQASSLPTATDYATPSYTYSYNQPVATRIGTTATTTTTATTASTSTSSTESTSTTAASNASSAVSSAVSVASNASATSSAEAISLLSNASLSNSASSQSTDTGDTSSESASTEAGVQSAAASSNSQSQTSSSSGSQSQESSASSSGVTAQAA